MIYLLLQASGPPSPSVLSPGERARASSMRILQRREEFVLGRWAAKRLIAMTRGVTPGPAIEVRAAASGKPEAYLRGARLHCSISISHRAGLALAALDESGAPLGADLELIEPRSAAFVRDWFSASEATGDALLANAIWSAKESVLKALGIGLRADPRSVEVELLRSPREWQPLRAGGWSGWWRRVEAHVVTVVAASPGEPRLLA